MASFFEQSLYKAISSYQDSLLEEAKQLVSGWLSQRDNFEEAADWLFGEHSNSLFQESKGTFAFDLVAYAIEAFNDWSDEQPDDEEVNLFYDQVREYFEC